MTVENNLSMDSSCSTDSSPSSSSSGSSVKVATSSARIVKRNRFGPAKAIRNGGQEVSQEQKGQVKRCDWITPNSGKLIIDSRNSAGTPFVSI
uniref:Uncharacterized protein n=1 Tax=Rhizophora mucronata TaxID=61149 RepID=A0A2P2P9H3_RHIMU